MPDEKFDFLGNSLSVGDTVLYTVGNTLTNHDVFDYGVVERFTEKAVIITRANIKREKYKERRLYSHQVIKVDPGHYTMHILKQQKENS